MRNSKDYDDVLTFAALLVMVLAVVAFLIYGLVAGEQKRITVVDRWWDTAIFVKYDYTSTCVGLDSDGDITVKSCTKTATRCSKSDAGREWPAVVPKPPCDMRRGDYTSTYVHHWFSYETDDGSFKSKKMSHADWDRFVPGRESCLVFNVFGGVKGVCKG